MSASFNTERATGVTGYHSGSAIGAKEPVAHPCNCRHECPYGYGKSFCFPCYKNIMEEHRRKKNAAVQGV